VLIDKLEDRGLLTVEWLISFVIQWLLWYGQILGAEVRLLKLDWICVHLYQKTTDLCLDNQPSSI